jgi:hypothetical protein
MIGPGDCAIAFVTDIFKTTKVPHGSGPMSKDHIRASFFLWCIAIGSKVFSNPGGIELEDKWTLSSSRIITVLKSNCSQCPRIQDYGQIQKGAIR